MFGAFNISVYNRKRKWKIFLREVHLDKNSLILDVGYTDQEYSPVDNYLEKYYPYLDRITALGTEDPKNFSKKYRKIKVIKYDGRIFPFRNKQFDICWSNATLEHVGGEDAQILFLREIARVSKKAFITTPNKNFPFEVHTRTPLLHFLPKNIFDAYLKKTGRSWATGGYMNLLTLRKIKRLLRIAGIKKYKIIKNKLLFWTLDFVIIFPDK